MFRYLHDHYQAYLRVKLIDAGYMLANRPDDGHVRTEICSLTRNKA